VIDDTGAGVVSAVVEIGSILVIHVHSFVSVLKVVNSFLGSAGTHRTGQISDLFLVLIVRFVLSKIDEGPREDRVLSQIVEIST